VPHVTEAAVKNRLLNESFCFFLRKEARSFFVKKNQKIFMNYPGRMIDTAH
jgi:hypothetical protein